MNNKDPVRLGACWLVLTIAAAARGEPPDDLARFIVAQLQESRSKLDQCVYDFERTFERRSGPQKMKVTTTGQWRQRGELRWISFSRHSLYGADFENLDKSLDSKIVAFIGRKSSGEYISGMNNPEQFLHDDVARPSDLEKLKR